MGNLDSAWSGVFKDSGSALVKMLLGLGVSSNGNYQSRTPACSMANGETVNIKGTLSVKRSIEICSSTINVS